MVSRIWAYLTVMAASAAVISAGGLNAQDEQEQPPHYSVTDLGTLGGTFSYPGGIDNRAQVAGSSGLPGTRVRHAFLWESGVMTDLGTLGGPNSVEITFGGPSERGTS